MKLTIFDVYLPMQDQAQCDRMKQVCIGNGLPYWEDDVAFYFEGLDSEPMFECYNHEFAVYNNNFNTTSKFQVTETEFMNLLKEYKNGNTN